ncbi:MAG: hypothetical protein HQ472_02675 [Ignavibacteria bacterium]|nr:hypothetical protein [Ignavibacteria bacterium]
MSEVVSKHISLELPIPASAVEAKKIITSSVLTNPRNTSLFSKAEWNNDLLEVESVFGKGTLQVADGKLLLEITLSVMGLAVKSTMISELKKRMTEPFVK